MRANQTPRARRETRARLTCRAAHACGTVVLALLLVAYSVLLPVTAYAREEALDFTPDDIVTIDRSLDGSRVRIVGEAIGEDLRADADHRWVNVLGDSTAVGVYVADELAEEISVFGDHKHSGDIVEVVGTLNIACDQHGGEFDIHAEQFTPLAEGGPVERPIVSWKGIAGVAALAVALVEARLLGYLRERTLA